MMGGEEASGMGAPTEPLPGTSAGHRRSIEMMNRLKAELQADARERQN
jgi:hypothetical protein